ncbi:MAG: hypothetical protein PHI66_04455 [Candidatus Pacebacteria bacterium]|nr:hypothetical protein [Candidatus Paceibacterota bacterium]
MKIKYIQPLTNPLVSKIIGLNLLFLFFFASNIADTDAKKEVALISIISGTTEVIETETTQEIRFIAEYETGMSEPADTYKLFVCQNKRLNKDNQDCAGLSFCNSGDFSSKNPLSCLYTAQEQATNNQFYMFVCNQSAECSSDFSGYLTYKNTLEISAPSEINLKGATFSFEGQTSTGNYLDIEVTSITNNRPGWSVDVMTQGWESDKGAYMDYDGDGTSSGQMTVNMDKATIESSDSVQGITLGETTPFSSSIQNINIATAQKKGGNGTFVIKEVNLEQFIPGNQEEGLYSTILIFTIS